MHFVIGIARAVPLAIGHDEILIEIAGVEP
jgi:hypothetical protein